MPRKKYRIGLALELDWPYKRHAGIFAGTQKYFDEHGWETVIDEFVETTLTVRNGGSIHYDGVIARSSASLAEFCQKLNLPLVNVWRSSPITDVVPSVFPDYEAAGRLRATHLLSRGLRNFATLGCQSDVSDQLEVRAYAEAVTASGYPCEACWIPHTFLNSPTIWLRSEKKISAWMDKWQPPIGVFVGTDNLGRIIVQKCRDRGWRIPQDVAIVAGRNEETLCEQPRPSITSVEMGYERVGYEAAKLLHQVLNGTDVPTTTILTPPLGLVVRESTDFLVVQDELVAEALTFIAMNCHRRIGQQDVARALSVETKTLQLRFRKVLNQPIAATIRKVRLERVKRELVQTDRSLKSIARDVGFSSPMRMYELFKRELGITPTQFRNERRL
ncbi:substrate-binding domain-containing protein [Bremerella sp. JC770]|uniref:substrate-binding domain-containing protein n=1 Tax=Bremerella sp. JC770 TaxID=3232137 RepID=UPI00345A2A2D